MLDFLAGEAVTITVPFTRDGEPFVPDANSVSWSLRGHDGSVLVASTTLSGITDTLAAINIAAANHNIVAGRVFEKRALTVRASSNGSPYTRTVAYRIHTWLNLSVTEASVRDYIGCDDAELPDEAIDLLGAYLKVASRAGQAVLDDALTSGTLRELQANSAVVAQGVLDCLPGLAQRLAKKETDGNRNIERFSLDIEQLERSAREALRIALEAVSAVNDATTTPTIFVVASRTDPITGT